MRSLPAVAATEALAARAIHARLGDTDVLHGIDLSLPCARWSSIVGPNGAGKSTLLKVLAGLLPHSGKVILMGQDLATLPGRDRARQLSWLGQGESGADDMNVYDVTMLGRLPPGWPRPVRLTMPRYRSRCTPRRPGNGATVRWVSYRAESASGCCWRAPWRCRRRCF
jgi:ABC-type sugar transport system ATPase subunit